MSYDITEEILAAITGGQHDICDHYDPYRCYTPIPDSKCHIRNPDTRCKHLKIEQLESGKFRYVCAKGCFDYHSSNKLH